MDRFIATGRASIVACADTIPRTPSTISVEGSRRANLERALASPGRPRGYKNYQEMLAAEKLTISRPIIPENARHAEVAEAAAGHGVHMVTEKPMAASLEQALPRMASAPRRRAGSPSRSIGPSPGSDVSATGKLLDDGAIGDVWELKWRNPASLGPLAHGSTHPGATVISGEVSDAEKGMEWWHQAEAGGGALLDYCCYGACVVSWLLPATPLSAQGLTANHSRQAFTPSVAVEPVTAVPFGVGSESPGEPGSPLFGTSVMGRTLPQYAFRIVVMLVERFFCHPKGQLSAAIVFCEFWLKLVSWSELPES